MLYRIVVVIFSEYLLLQVPKVIVLLNLEVSSNNKICCLKLSHVLLDKNRPKCELGTRRKNNLPYDLEIFKLGRAEEEYDYELVTPETDEDGKWSLVHNA